MKSTKFDPTRNEKYHAYLRSEAWRAKRKRVCLRAGNVCERCDGRSGCVTHECHHYTYKNLFCESLDDLGWLCVHCHELLHGLRREDPLRAEDPNDPEDWIKRFRERMAKI